MNNNIKDGICYFGCIAIIIALICFILYFVIPNLGSVDSTEYQDKCIPDYQTGSCILYKKTNSHVLA